MDAAPRLVLETHPAQSEHDIVARWLAQFDVALQSESHSSLATLFAPDAHFRDLMAFTWSITPRQGADDIAALMAAQQRATKARGFAIAEGRTSPRRVQRAGIDVIEGIFKFETDLGRGFGVVRLLASNPSKAFQLMTSLHELKGFEERIGQRAPTGEAFSRNFGGTNWKEQRDRKSTRLNSSHMSISYAVFCLKKKKKKKHKKKLKKTKKKIKKNQEKNL